MTASTMTEQPSALNRDATNDTMHAFCHTQLDRHPAHVVSGRGAPGPTGLGAPFHLPLVCFTSRLSLPLDLGLVLASARSAVIASLARSSESAGPAPRGAG
jgi:hypothetical protein